MHRITEIPYRSFLVFNYEVRRCHVFVSVNTHAHKSQKPLKSLTYQRRGHRTP
jgi:hypothetical protein